ncbi:MAG: efflux RND transporter periplasmic adaptor subunit [Lachnospiraceae bacterium]|nr:efflux RND transporter periplasmic adaptor subunit [Lachnospiraceae bacterium]
MKKKTKIIIVIIVILAIIGGTAGYFLLRDKEDAVSDEYVYVDTVSDIMGTGYVVDSRYMGIVEAQETKNINPDSDKKVKQLLVSEGDTVKKGDPLFEYDTEEMNLKLKQLELELQSINNNIATLNTQINELVKERDAAPAENKIEYTSQIQNLQAQVNQNNYDASAKQLEIDRQSAAMDNNVVTSPMDGIVKEINESATSSSNSYDDYEYYQNSSNDKAYISIMAMGDYRIKGTASELNVRSMSKGDPVIVHSRLDDTLTWKGTISEIDLEHTENNNNNMYYYFDGGSSESTSNYPFYINLDNLDGLILGEHVYIELDYGQGEVKDGVWLSEFYIITETDGSYVWVENDKGKIEKRNVTLGEYSEDMWAYEITGGLTNDDYIAFPEERIKEGMTTTRNYEDVMIYEDYDYEDYDYEDFDDYEENYYNDGEEEIIDLNNIDGLDVDEILNYDGDMVIDEDGNVYTGEDLEEFQDDDASGTEEAE